MYENDIINVQQYQFDSLEKNEIQGVITFSKQSSAFVLTKKKKKLPLCDIYGLSEESYLVIGNCRLNPELLETK